MASLPALLIVDVQQAIDDPKWGRRNNPSAEQVIARLLKAWRDAKGPIYHIRHDSIEADSPYRPGTPGHAFKDAAAPLPEETIVPKTTFSAFTGTDLERQLTQAGHNRLVIVGVLTNHSLDTTVRHAGNLGFAVSVVAAACWSVDKIDLRGELWRAEDIHALYLANMASEYATVIDEAAAVAFLG